MDLWIRTQSKECLIKVSNIQYSFINNLHVIGVYYDDLKLLGKYKTKERALEVLDDIQKILSPIMKVDTYKFEQAELLNGTKFIKPMLEDIKIESAQCQVYEMPEE